MANDVTHDLIHRAAPYVPDFELDRKAKPTRDIPWQTWLDAELGFRNHWYPVDASRNFLEDEVRVMKLLGEDIIFVRRGGTMYAVEDRCPHRGSRFSVRPLFYTDKTITCWHHTWTFNLDDGKVRAIFNNPDSERCGKTGIKAYPVQEQKGIVFIFIGDKEPHDLADDVPPGFLDEDMAVCVADPYVVHSNWRLGCEGGYDPGHHFIHNWSPFAMSNGIPFSYGMVSSNEELFDTTEYVSDEGGPKGFTRKGEKTDMRFSATIPARGDEPETVVTLPLARDMTPEQMAANQNYTTDIGLWLPCGLLVTPFPAPGAFHNEYYVPIDAQSHYYFQCGWRRVKSEEEREAWEGDLGYSKWKVPVVDGFTREDAEAREGINKFYAEENGWKNEIISGSDIELLMWRIFASENCGGVQTENHARGMFKR